MIARAQPYTIEETVPWSRWDALSNFLAETYAPHYVMRYRDLFAWQFRHPNDRDRATVICAYAQGRIVGMLGYTPTRLFWGDHRRPIVGAWMANWMVRAECRVGIGLSLIRRAQKMFPVVLGQGANVMNRAIVPRMGFVFHEYIPRYISVFNPERAALLIDSTARAAQATTREVVHWQPSGESPSRTIVHGSEAVSPDVFQPNWEHYPALWYGTVRDAAYLNYRYVQHPMFTYEIVRCGYGSSPAVCVYRIEHSRGFAAVTVGRIVEFFYPETPQGCADGETVIRYALHDMQARGCVFGDFYCTADCYRVVLERSGMHIEQTPVLPSRLQPIEAVVRSQNLEYWNAPSLGAIPGIGALYVTRADGDQDRPNVSYGS